jgi:hypothetical protein
MIRLPFLVNGTPYDGPGGRTRDHRETVARRQRSSGLRTTWAGVEGGDALAVNPMPSGELPYLDEHEIVIAADVDAVWTALLDTVGPTFSRTPMAVFARAVGCADREASGPRPLAEGSTIPGFHVVTVVPRAELLLAGHHRFAKYAMKVPPRTG